MGCECVCWDAGTDDGMLLCMVACVCGWWDVDVDVGM